MSGFQQSRTRQTETEIKCLYPSKRKLMVHIIKVLFCNVIYRSFVHIALYLRSKSSLIWGK